MKTIIESQHLPIIAIQDLCAMTSVRVTPTHGKIPNPLQFNPHTLTP